MYCTHCGNDISEGEAFCSRCGAPVAPVLIPSSPALSPRQYSELVRSAAPAVPFAQQPVIDYPQKRKVN